MRLEKPMNRQNKFSASAYPGFGTGRTDKVNGRIWLIKPFANTQMSNEQFRAVVRCRVCDNPYANPKRTVERLRELAIFSLNLVESGGNYYLVCSDECRELFELNPLSYE